jgi:flagellar protein FlbD
MILLTRLTGRPMIVNAELIKTIEETPDTMVTLLNGDRIIVKETMVDVVKRAIEYGRQLRCFSPPVNSDSTGPSALAAGPMSRYQHGEEGV